MVQIIDNSQDRSSLSTGLSSLLQGLAHSKVQEMQQKKSIHALESFLPELKNRGGSEYILNLPAKEQLQLLQGLGDQERQNPQRQQQENPFNPEEMKYLQDYFSNPESSKNHSPEEFKSLMDFINPQQQHPELTEEPIPGQNVVGQYSPIGKQQPEIRQQKKEGFKLSQLGANKSSGVDIKVQNNIDRKYQKYNDYIDNARDNSDSIINTGEKLKELAGKGTVSEGLAGDVREKVPFGLTGANDDTREFVSLSNQLIDDSANLIKGVATNFKIKLKQAAKVNLGMPKDVKIKRINQAIESAQKARDIGDIRDQVVEENGGLVPDNLPTLVRKRYQEWNKESEGKPDLDPNDYADDDVIQFDNSLWEKKSDGLGWQIYKGNVK